MRPNHVWCAAVTCIPVQRGFPYVGAVMDWTRWKMPPRHMSNTLEASF